MFSACSASSALIVVFSIVTSNQYHFITHWRVEGTCGEVADILGDPLLFPRWWPSVYLDVRETAPAGPDGLGRRIALVTRVAALRSGGVRRRRVAISVRAAIAAEGEFDGRGVWTFEQAGRFVDITGCGRRSRCCGGCPSCERCLPPATGGQWRRARESAAGTLAAPRSIGGVARGGRRAPVGHLFRARSSAARWLAERSRI